LLKKKIINKVDKNIISYEIHYIQFIDIIYLSLLQELSCKKNGMLRQK